MTGVRWLWTVGARMWRGSSARRDAGPAAASCGSSSLRDRDPAGQRLPQKDEGQAECCRRASTLSSTMHAPCSSSMLRIMTESSHQDLSEGDEDEGHTKDPCSSVAFGTCRRRSCHIT